MADQGDWLLADLGIIPYPDDPDPEEWYDEEDEELIVQEPELKVGDWVRFVGHSHGVGFGQITKRKGEARDGRSGWYVRFENVDGSPPGELWWEEKWLERIDSPANAKLEGQLYVLELGARELVEELTPLYRESQRLVEIRDGLDVDELQTELSTRFGGVERRLANVLDDLGKTVDALVRARARLSDS